MQKIHLQKPYKIVLHKVKRYSSHYGIPAENCVLIPFRTYGEDVACDVRWEDENGVLKLRERLFFTADNIEPVDAIKNYTLYELWHHFDKPDVMNSAQQLR